MTRRVALIHEILSPYREPLFAALAADPGLDCTVVHVAKTEPRRDWGGGFENLPYPWRRVGAVAFTSRRTHGTWFVPRGLGRALDDLDPDVVVVPGYSTLASLGALAWTRRRHRGLVMWSEGAYGRSGPTVERVKRAFTAACQAYVVPGELARLHLEELGADPSAIHVAPNCIDLSLFAPSTDPAPSVRRFIASARLESRKGLDVAIDGLHRADPDHRAELVIVGDGPDRGALETQASRLGVPVTFVGSVPYEKVAAHLQAADAFVFPTREDIWGFALQEAAATGLPMVSSVYAGATRELVVEGVTGWSVLPEPESVAVALRRVLDLAPDALRSMRRAARGAAERLSVDAAVAAFRSAVEQAVDPRARGRAT